MPSLAQSEAAVHTWSLSVVVQESETSVVHFATHLDERLSMSQ